MAASPSVGLVPQDLHIDKCVLSLLGGRVAGSQPTTIAQLQLMGVARVARVVVPSEPLGNTFS
jgi:hypothetical protein